MIYTPALNLFLYNSLLSHAMQHVVRINEGGYDQSSPWDYVSIIGGIRELSHELPTGSNVFPDILVHLNFFINGLVLLPGVKLHRGLSFLVAVVIIWNIFMLERLFAFELTLIWSLWYRDVSCLTHAIVIACITFINFIHLMLILDSIKMHHGYLRRLKKRRWWMVRRIHHRAQNNSLST